MTRERHNGHHTLNRAQSRRIGCHDCDSTILGHFTDSPELKHCTSDERGWPLHRCTGRDMGWYPYDWDLGPERICNGREARYLDAF